MNLSGFISIGRFRIEKKSFLIGCLALPFLMSFPVIGGYLDGLFTKLRETAENTIGKIANSSRKASK